MAHRLLKLTAIAAAGVLVVGCSGGGSAEPADIEPVSNPVAGEAPEGVLEGVTMTYAADGGTTQDAQMNAFFTPFAEVTGAQLNQDSPQTLAKIQSQVDTGSFQWDFVSSYADTIAQECDVLFEKIDESKLDLSNVPKSLLGATECGVPSIPYAMMIVYNGDTYGDDGPQSWADFYDTEKFPGTRALNSGDGKIDGSIVQGAAIAAG